MNCYFRITGRKPISNTTRLCKSSPRFSKNTTHRKRLTRGQKAGGIGLLPGVVHISLPARHSNKKKELTREEREKYYDFVKEFEKEVDNSMMMADYIGTVSLFSRYKVEESNPPELFKKENANMSWDGMLEKMKSSSENNYLSQLASAILLVTSTSPLTKRIGSTATA